MGTTAEKLQAISNTKAAIKTAIEAKGVTVGDVRFADYPSKIGEIQQGQVDKKKYGVGIDDLLGDVQNGKYSSSKSNFKLDFSGISAIEDTSLQYKFAYTNVTDVDLRDLEYSGIRVDVDYQGGYLDNTFSYCSKLSSVNLQNLKRLGGSPVYPGLKYTFFNCFSLSSISFPSLTAINSNGLEGSFNGMTQLTSMEFPALVQLSGNNIFKSTYSSSDIVRVDFSALERINGFSIFYAAFNSLNYNSSYKDQYLELHFQELTSINMTSNGQYQAMFSVQSKLNPTFRAGCKIYFYKLRDINSTNLFTSGSFYQFVTEIHFPSDAEDSIKASPGWATLWGLGAGSCEVIFDL